MKAVETGKKAGSRKMRLLSLALGSALVLMGMCPAMLAQDTKPDPPKPDSARDYAPTYRLTYTLTEMDGTRRVGAQRFSMTVTPPDRATLKVGSKVPVATGSYNPSNSPAGAQTQFTYIDVGVNIDARLTQFANGMLLTTKAEQLGVAEMTGKDIQPIANFHEPVIRQASLTNTALVQLGKPVMLGALDTPGSARHVDVEVLLELVK